MCFDLVFMILFVQHVDVDGKRSSSASDSRGELLDQIRQGIELKSVSFLVFAQKGK